MLLVSLVPLYYQAQEIYLSRIAYGRYAVSLIGSDRVAFGDDLVRQVGKQVVVSDRPVFLPNYSYRQPAFLRLDDKKSAKARLALIGRHGYESRASWTYEVIFIGHRERIVRDHFSYRERDRPLYRTLLARFVSPQGIGFRSDVLQLWPTVLYPIIYPWLTTLVAIVLLTGSRVWRPRPRIVGKKQR